jgi:hypothetical protein
MCSYLIIVTLLERQTDGRKAGQLVAAAADR